MFEARSMTASAIVAKMESELVEMAAYNCRAKRTIFAITDPYMAILTCNVRGWCLIRRKGDSRNLDTTV